MKMRIVLLSAALLMLAVPLLAGSEKCSYSAQVCLNHWAEKKDAGWAGIDYDKSTEGVYKVKAVTAGSPAEAAGFQAGDILTAVNGVSMTADKASLKKAKGAWSVGQSVTYTIQRAGAEQQLSLTLAKTPEAVFASMLGSHMLESHAVMAAAASEGKAKAASAEKR